METNEAVDVVARQAELDRILDSSDDLVSKVRKVMRLGFGEEISEDLVERHQLGFRPPAYYNQMLDRRSDDDY